jgi:hypothetical protein
MKKVCTANLALSHIVAYVRNAFDSCTFSANVRRVKNTNYLIVFE